MKILLIIDSVSQNGAMTALRWLLNKIVSETKCEVTLFQLAYSKSLGGVPNSVVQVGFPPWMTRERLGFITLKRLFTTPCQVWQMIGLRLLSLFFSLPHWVMRVFNIHREKYDVAISFTDDFANRVCGAFRAKKHFGWCHEDYSLEYPSSSDKAKIREYLLRLDGVFCVSKTSKQILEGILYNSDVNKIHVCHNFLPLNEVNKRGVSGDGLQILSVGRLTSAKRFEWCLEAADILKKQRIAFLWTILGEGEERGYLESIIRERQLGDYVRLPGSSDSWREDFPEGAIYVQPSRREGWGLALEEAALSGYRIICSALPVFEEIAKWGGFDFLYADSAEDIAKRIVELCSSEYIAQDEFRTRIEFGYKQDFENLVKVISK